MLLVHKLSPNIFIKYTTLTILLSTKLLFYVTAIQNIPVQSRQQVQAGQQSLQSTLDNFRKAVSVQSSIFFLNIFC